MCNIYTKRLKQTTCELDVALEAAVLLSSRNLKKPLSTTLVKQGKETSKYQKCKLQQQQTKPLSHYVGEKCNLKIVKN